MLLFFFGFGKFCFLPLISLKYNIIVWKINISAISNFFIFFLGFQTLWRIKNQNVKWDHSWWIWVTTINPSSRFKPPFPLVFGLTKKPSLIRVKGWKLKNQRISKIVYPIVPIHLLNIWKTSVLKIIAFFILHLNASTYIISTGRQSWHYTV